MQLVFLEMFAEPHLSRPALSGPLTGFGLSPKALVACLFTVAAIVFGGGGSSAPLSELVLQLIAAVALAAWLMVPAANAAEESGPKGPLLILVAIVVGLPALQLIPLPPAIWQHLPGREPEIRALSLVDAEGHWMPWSMTPARTFASLLAIMPPVLAMTMVASLRREGRTCVIATVVIMAAISVLLGALQLSAGRSGDWHLYGPEHSGFLIGFQANRNAEADLLLIAICGLAAVTFGMRRKLGPALARGMLIGAGAVFLVACVLTGSRTGILLLPIAAICSIAIWFPRAREWRMTPRILQVSLLLGALAALLYLFVLRENYALSQIFGRFDFEQNARFDLWTDTRFAVETYWPFGSGIGSFQPIFIAAESLEAVDPTMPVRAHNDYLELLLEAGLFGALALFAVTVLILGLLVRSWRHADRTNRHEVLFAASALLILAIHSIVDFPLRSMAIAHLAGLAVGLLAANTPGRRSAEAFGV